MSLKILKPISVIPEMLSSSVLLDDYPDWIQSENYPAEARVVRNFKIWQSLKPDNRGNDPLVYGDFWVLVGPVNRMKAFDTKHTTKTKFSLSAWFEIDLTDAINAISILACDGITSVMVKMTHPIYGVVYEKNIFAMPLPEVTGWYAWAFEKRYEQTAIHFFDLPSYRNSKVRIEFQATTDAGIGVILLGQQKDIGYGVSPGLSMGLRDFSRKERDQWGDVVLQERAYARERSFKVFIDKSQIDNTDRVLTSLRATPALWMLSTKHEQANVYGWASDFRISVDYGPYCILSLQLEGLI